MRRRARALLLAVAVAARVFDTQRAVSLPVDSERQRVVTVDASPRAVKRALRRYDARSHKACGAVVAKAHRRHERNVDGLGAQVLRADQLAPLLLAHLTVQGTISARPWRRSWRRNGPRGACSGARTRSQRDLSATSRRASRAPRPRNAAVVVAFRGCVMVAI